jgi:hypothetical protein
MRSYGNTFQWPDGYPRDDMFKKDIELGGSHVMLDDRGEVVGTFALLPSPEVTYNKIYNGQWLDDEPYYVIHRIASFPDAHGIFKSIMEFSFAHESNIRIDTHKNNHIMQHNILKHGFTYCGIIHLASGDERLAYQKLCFT